MSWDRPADRMRPELTREEWEFLCRSGLADDLDERWILSHLDAFREGYKAGSPPVVEPCTCTHARDSHEDGLQKCSECWCEEWWKADQ